jgi:hypothetical protein
VKCVVYVTMGLLGALAALRRVGAATDHEGAILAIYRQPYRLHCRRNYPQ